MRPIALHLPFWTRQSNADLRTAARTWLRCFLVCVSLSPSLPPSSPPLAALCAPCCALGPRFVFLPGRASSCSLAWRCSLLLPHCSLCAGVPAVCLSSCSPLSCPPSFAGASCSLRLCRRHGYPTSHASTAQPAARCFVLCQPLSARIGSASSWRGCPFHWLPESNPAPTRQTHRQTTRQETTTNVGCAEQRGARGSKIRAQRKSLLPSEEEDAFHLLVRNEWSAQQQHAVGDKAEQQKKQTTPEENDKSPGAVCSSSSGLRSSSFLLLRRKETATRKNQGSSEEASSDVQHRLRRSTERSNIVHSDNFQGYLGY